MNLNMSTIFWWSQRDLNPYLLRARQEFFQLNYGPKNLAKRKRFELSPPSVTRKCSTIKLPFLTSALFDGLSHHRSQCKTEVADILFGGSRRLRTFNFSVKSRVLCQLSYRPKIITFNYHYRL